jgi:FkbM family methyltransferase
MSHSLLGHYLQRTRAIAELPVSSGAKRRLLSCYTRMTWTYFRKGRLSRHPVTSFALWHMEFAFIDFAVLRHLFEEIFISRIYAVPLERDVPLILDCGSNIGMSIAFFQSEYPGAHIVGFEPDPANFKCLAANAQKNFPGVTIHEKALSDHAGVTSLFSTDQSGDSTTKTLFKDLLGDVHVRSHDISVVRLSDYVAEPVDLLKLDVEGAETLVLKDLVETGKITFIRKLIVEYHDIRQDHGDTLSAFLKILEDQGFLYTLAAQPHMQGEYIDIRAIQHVLIYATREASRVPVAGMRT